MRDWVAWHEAYDDPSSPHSARLHLVRAHLAGAIERAPAGPVRLVSLCAGQGHDVIGVLRDHPRRDDVRAVLVEADPENAAVARERAAGAGLGQVEVRLADASRVASFADALPAGVLMLCGIFGNVSEPDIERTIAAAATFVIPGGTVIWTRHGGRRTGLPASGICSRGRLRGDRFRQPGDGPADRRGRRPLPRPSRSGGADRLVARRAAVRLPAAGAGVSGWPGTAGSASPSRTDRLLAPPRPLP